MKPSEDPKLLEIVKATGEIYGKQVSLAAGLMFLADLDHFTSQQVISALSRCRKEMRTFPTVADVAARIDDGRPGVEEAWAMIPHDEASSVVWTEEMQHAFSICRQTIDVDRVAARMAFKEAYQQAVANNRATGTPVRWSPSLGFDKSGREVALRDAVTKGRLTLEHAETIMPEFQLAPPKRKPEITGPSEGGLTSLQSVLTKMLEDKGSDHET